MAPPDPLLGTDTVVGVAVVRHGRLLAARRTAPERSRGRWELPGGKVEPGEDLPHAAVREVREELGVTVRVTGSLARTQRISDRFVLRVLLAELVAGEPVPGEHDVLRWLGPEELEEVDWLDPDRPFLPELRELLLEGERLEGGNVGGAVRIGGTVRRATGPWTPSVHRLLGHLRRAGLPAVPEVHGVDARGREVLTHLPGRVVDITTELLTDAQLGDLARWTRSLHDALADFDDPGPWRFFGVAAPTSVTHNDLAPYNVCFAGDRLTGVFDWDLAGPASTLLELAQLAWTAVPLVHPVPDEDAARRLALVARAYGGVSASEILAAVPGRVQLAVDGIRTAVARGDEAMRNLMLVGEPENTERALAALLPRVPGLERLLAHPPRGHSFPRHAGEPGRQ